MRAPGEGRATVILDTAKAGSVYTGCAALVARSHAPASATAFSPARKLLAKARPSAAADETA